MLYENRYFTRITANLVNRLARDAQQTRNDAVAPLETPWWEELQESRAQIEIALQRYNDIYDFAPAGYLLLDHCGAILQSNLTGATMLEVNRADLIGQRLALFVSEADRAALHAFITQVFASRSQQVCEVALKQPSGQTHHQCQYVQLLGIVSPDGKECMITVIGRCIA